MRYILVTGGELYNKGAQAMTFITVCELAKRYPDRQVILFSSRDARERSAEEQDNYTFKILPLPTTYESLALTSKVWRLVFARKLTKNFGVFEEIFKNADALVDISGYALGSNWGNAITMRYLMRIFVAKHFHIPAYLMPQSFGPFDYKGPTKLFVKAMMKHYLGYCMCIMAREMEGKKLLEEKYRLSNVVKTPDLVLQGKEIDLSYVFKNTPPQRYTLPIMKGSIAVIPNSKNNKYGDEATILALYKSMIDILLENQKNIYLIYHAIEDLQICEKIKKTYYQDENAVCVVEQELSCIDFGNIVGQFDFVIASRYHSVVHAYKACVPAIVVGWAIKYRELAMCFEQERYCFNVQNALDQNNIMGKVEAMSAHFEEESRKIATGLHKIQQGNVYDYIRI